jgi:biotin carboxylase
MGPDRVLVLGNVGPSLTVIRSLARAGFEVVVGCDVTRPVTDRSRHAAEFWTHPSPARDEREFVRALAGFLGARRDLSVVFPVGELTLAAIARHATTLPPGRDVVMPDPAVLLTCLDKPSMHDIVGELGIPLPRSERAATLADLAAAAAAVGYPCVVKPVDSMRAFLGRKALLCHAVDDLDRAFPSWPAGNETLLVQQFAPGYRHNCQFAAVNGELLAYFEHRSTRTDRLDGMGHEVVGQAVAPTPALQQYTSRLVARLEYSGVGCAQFTTDDRGDVAAFMEINPRLDGVCALPYHLGYDFPRLAVECARGAVPADLLPTGYEPGARIHWLLGDLAGLGGAVMRGEVTPAVAGQWLAQTVVDAASADFHLTWSTADPRPTVALYGRAARALARRIRKQSGMFDHPYPFGPRRPPFGGAGAS